MNRKLELLFRFKDMTSQDIIKLPIDLKNELLLTLKKQLNHLITADEKNSKTKLIHKNRGHSYKNYIRKSMPKIIHQLKSQIRSFSSKSQKIMPLRQGQIELKSILAQDYMLKSETHFKKVGESHNKQEISCSICLQILLKPVLTTCGHIFCYQCLDQSLLFSTNCPNCRQNIKGTELIVSPIVEIFLHKVVKYSKNFSTYKDRLRRFQEWKKKREGLMLDVRDTEHIWCQGQILEVIKEENRNNSYNSVLVHFNRWNKIYNEIIEFPSSRLAPLHFFSSRTDIPRYSLSQDDGNMRGLVVSGPIINLPQQVVNNYIQIEQSSQSEVAEPLIHQNQDYFQNNIIDAILLNLDQVDFFNNDFNFQEDQHIDDQNVNQEAPHILQQNDQQ